MIWRWDHFQSVLGNPPVSATKVSRWNCKSRPLITVYSPITMPLPKRALAEIDPTSEVDPKPKRTTKTRMTGKENEAPAPIENLEKNRRTMPRKPIQDQHAQRENGSRQKKPGVRKAAAKPKQATTKKTTTPKMKTPAVPEGKDVSSHMDFDAIEWHSICDWDPHFDPDEGVKSPKECDGGLTCACQVAKSKQPGTIWTITAKGHEFARELYIQRGHRDQDLFDMHILNDFNGYGITEVIENIVSYIKNSKAHDPGTQSWLSMKIVSCTS